jgi:hypothetical protein
MKGTTKYFPAARRLCRRDAVTGAWKRAGASRARQAVYSGQKCDVGVHVRFLEMNCGGRVTDMVKVFGRRPPQVARLGTGPAYGNRPSTKPRGRSATLWGFEDSATPVWVTR